MPTASSLRRKPQARPRPQKYQRRSLPFWRRALIWSLTVFLGLYFTVVLSILTLRWIHPSTTAVQIERRLSAFAAGESYQKRYRFVPLDAISPHLQHAVIAAEDTRFFQHHGFDWQEVSVAIREDLEEGRRRGASTLTQQLVRNLFLSTGPSALRKLAEFSLVPPTEAFLSKHRILELYLNVVEWGPGIFGADAAARVYFHEPARALSRQQCLELASLLPAPLRRKPGKVEWYVARIDERMRAMHW